MMKLLQKILSHGLLIAFLVAGVFLYMHRAEIFPQWFDRNAQPVAQAPTAERKTASPAIKQQQPTGSQAQAVADMSPRESAETVAPIEPPTAAATPEDPGTPAEPAETDPPLAAAPASAEQVVDIQPLEKAVSPPDDAVEVTRTRPIETDQPAEPAEVAVSVEIPVSAAPEPTAATVTSPPLSAVQPLQPAVEETPMAASSATQPTPGVPASGEAPESPLATTPSVPQQEAAPLTQAKAGDVAVESGLEQARALYWRRDTSAAAAAYQAVGEANPDNAEVWGEIGNFYYSLRQREPATEAYVHSLSLLIESGELERARQLLEVLYKLDADRARDMEQKLLRTGG